MQFGASSKWILPMLDLASRVIRASGNARLAGWIGGAGPWMGYAPEGPRPRPGFDAPAGSTFVVHQRSACRSLAGWIGGEGLVLAHEAVANVLFVTPLRSCCGGGSSFRRRTRPGVPPTGNTGGKQVIHLSSAEAVGNQRNPSEVGRLLCFWVLTAGHSPVMS